MKNLKLLFAFTFVLFISSCSDDDDTTPKEEKLTYRIKTQICSYKDTYETKTTYHYNKNNTLDSVRIYDYNDKTQQWEQESKCYFSYSGNTIEAIEKRWYEESKIWKNKVKIMFTLSNGQISEYVYYTYNEDKWTKNSKSVYSYQASNLLEWKELNNEDKETYKLSAEYKDNQLITVNTYEDINNALKQIRTAAYNYDDKAAIQSIIEYSINDEGIKEEESKTEFTFTNNLISRIDYYDYNSTSKKFELNEDEAMIYKYNEFNLLISEVNGNEKWDYEYEKGQGNAYIFDTDPEDKFEFNPSIQ